MQGNQTSAFFMSTLLHGIVAGLLLILAYVGGEKAKEAPRIFELVAGEGDNYMATEAPALGVAGGIKIDIPEPPEPRPVVERSPVQAAPEPVIERVTEPAAKKAEAIPDLNKMLKQKAAITQIRKEANDRRARQIAERKAKAEAALKAKEEAAKTQRMSKADFDRQNKSKSNAPRPKGAAPKIAKIDAEGIAKGVLGGNAANKIGGAGGTALTRSEGDAVDGYAALLGTKIKAELDERPGVGAGLIVEVEIRILVDGTLKGFRIVRSSGSSDFDQAVREAFDNIRMPARPKGLSELQRFPIRGVE